MWKPISRRGSRVEAAASALDDSGLADLFEILEFVAADSPGAPRRLGREVLTQSKTLSNSAWRGRRVPELLEQGITTYREILVSRYRVIYNLRPEAVQIAAVMDARRDVGEVLFRRLLR